MKMLACQIKQAEDLIYTCLILMEGKGIGF